MITEPVEAWYVYSVLPASGRAPVCDGVLPGTQVEAIPLDDLMVLASPVPRALFDSTNPANRTAEADWMAARIEAHHSVNVAATDAGPCLPLAFGSLFSSLDLLRDWLVPQAQTLRAALTRVSGRTEWAVALQEDGARHAAWLDRHDPELSRLHAAIASAGEGTAYLMTRRLEKRRAAVRTTQIAAATATIAKRLSGAGFDVIDEQTSRGLPGWTILVAGTAALEPLNPLAQMIEALAIDLHAAGLSLRLSGPWPAYAFARAALTQEAACG